MLCRAYQELPAPLSLSGLETQTSILLEDLVSPFSRLGRWESSWNHLSASTLRLLSPKDWRQKKVDVQILESADLVKIPSAFNVHEVLSQPLFPILKNGNYNYNTSLDYQEDQMR